MNTILPEHIFAEKLAGFVDWITDGRWQIVPTQTVDDLHAEIYQLEKTLANAPTRPTHIRKSKQLEPVTERQKIMDLAGWGMYIR